MIVEETSHTQSKSSCPDEDPTPQIKKITKMLDGKLPIQIDEDTRLDSIKGDSSGLTYFQTLVNVGPGELDAEQIEKFSSVMRPIFIKQVCLQPEYRHVIDNGATIT